MIDRIARATSSARQKKIAELEKAASAEEARVAASKKKRLKNKSMSKNEDDGSGSAKAKTTAKDKFKSPKPKPKGNKADSKLTVTGPVGPVTKSPKKEKQKALDEATDSRQDVTSDIPKLPSTPKPKIKNSTKQPDPPKLPKPKLSPASRKAWRKEKLAELRTALNNPAKPSGVLDDMGEEVPEITDAPPSGKGTAKKPQLAPAYHALQISQKLVPEITKSLGQANDMLEDAIMDANLQKIKGALAFLLTKIQEVTKHSIVPMGATVRKLMQALSPKQAAARPKLAASVSAAVKNLDQLDSEFARSKVLMRMASGKITL